MSKPNVKINRWRMIPLDPIGEQIVLIGEIQDHPKYGTYLGRTGLIISFNEEKKYAESHNTRYILGDSEEDRLKKIIQIKELENTLETEQIKESISKEFEKLRENQES